MVLLRAGLTNGRTIDITGYDLELGRFDSDDGKTREYEQFDYFIVPREEMQAIVAYFEDKNKSKNVHNEKKEFKMNKLAE